MVAAFGDTIDGEFVNHLDKQNVFFSFDERNDVLFAVVSIFTRKANRVGRCDKRWMFAEGDK